MKQKKNTSTESS